MKSKDKIRMVNYHRHVENRDTGKNSFIGVLLVTFIGWGLAYHTVSYSEKFAGFLFFGTAVVDAIIIIFGWLTKETNNYHSNRAIGYLQDDDE